MKLKSDTISFSWVEFQFDIIQFPKNSQNRQNGQKPKDHLWGVLRGVFDDFGPPYPGHQGYQGHKKKLDDTPKSKLPRTSLTFLLISKNIIENCLSNLGGLIGSDVGLAKFWNVRI